MTRRKALLFIIAFILIPIIYLLIKRTALQSKYSAKDLENYRGLIAEIADMIIPRTDSPGAKDAKVDDFIINVMQNCESKRSQSNFISGLVQLNRESHERFKSSFSSCSNHDKAVMLQELESRRIPHPFLNKVKNKLLGPSFFDQIKMLTVKGYCISREGATRGFAYDPLPKNFISCINYIPNQKAWATR